MANMVDIKNFFEEGANGRKVKVTEMKALSPEDRTDLKTLLSEGAITPDICDDLMAGDSNYGS